MVELLEGPFGQRDAEAFLNALAQDPVIDFASDCCIGIVTTVIATTPNNASAAIMAIIAIEVALFSLRDW